MKKVLFCLVVTLTLVGCKQKKEEVADIRSTGVEHFRDLYEDFVSPDGRVYAFFFDIDGDGVDEAFTVGSKMINRDGNDWRTWHYQDGKWQKPKGEELANFLYAYTEDIYYRDDVKQQPRLFAADCDVASPASISLTKDRYLVVAPFDKAEFDRLKAKGILKPVEAHWYDKDNKIVQ